MEKRKEKTIANNKKAYHDYFIEETVQAGIELVGTEVKSLRAGRCNLMDSYVEISGGEAYINGMHISPYDHGNVFNKDPLRRRRLLLHKYQIRKFIGASTREGYTIVPTKVYFDGAFVKVDVALAKGKKLYDKRAVLAEKAQRRDAEREFRERNG